MSIHGLWLWLIGRFLLLFCLVVVQFLRHVCALCVCVCSELNWSLTRPKLNLFGSNCIFFFQAYLYRLGTRRGGEHSGVFVNFIC